MNAPIYTNLEQLVASLHLKASPDDRDGVRREIVLEMSALHPDKNGGVFSDAASEDRFAALNHGLASVDSGVGLQLVPVHQILAIVQAVTASMKPSSTESLARDRLIYRESAALDARTRIMIPRVGSGACAAVCAAIFAFSSSLKDNPVLAPLSAVPGFYQLLVMGFLLSGFFFLGTWWIEQHQLSRAEWLASDSGLRAILDHLTEDRSVAEHGSFSMLELSDTISRLGSRFIFPFPVRSSLGGQTAEKLAKLHVEELEKRGMVKKTGGKLFSVTYAMEPELLEELRRSERHRW